ncbi:MAG: sulfotransferase [Phycisphaerales bacterium JB052]
MAIGGQSKAFQQVADEYDRILQLQQNGQGERALEGSKGLVAKQPKWPYAHFSLGLSLILLGRFDEARRSLRKAVSLKDGVGAFHAKLGEVLHRLDDTEGAMVEIDRAIGLEPDNPGYVITKAWMQRLSGQTDEAYTLLHGLYEQGQRDHRLVRIYAGTLGQIGEPQRAIDALLPLAQSEHPDPKVLAAHWYVLAKLYDQTEQYDKAYDAASRGSELNAKTYDPDARESLMHARLKAWSAESMPNLARSRASTDKPVFIVGMPRSGTTLVEQIIASHPEAYGAGERMNIFTAAAELTTPSDPEISISALVSGLKTATLDRTARRILRDMEKQAPAGSKPQRICDKMLLNFQHLGLIEQLFPNARVIICNRNPLDNFISAFLLDFEGHNAHAYTDRPEWFAHFYRLHQQYIEHFKQVCSLQILDVVYEDIVADQRGQTQRLLEHLDLPFDEACMRFYEHQRAVITASTDQVRQQIYRKAVSRHTHYAEYLDPLRDAMYQYGVTGI